MLVTLLLPFSLKYASGVPILYCYCPDPILDSDWIEPVIRIQDDCDGKAGTPPYCELLEEHGHARIYIINSVGLPQLVSVQHYDCKSSIN